MKIKQFHELCFVNDDGTDSPRFKVDDEGLIQLRALLAKYKDVKAELEENRAMIRPSGFLLKKCDGNHAESIICNDPECWLK